jgi:hypothetical protein
MFMTNKSKRDLEKENWALLKPLVGLPDNKCPGYHQQYMAATRKVAKLSQNPQFNEALMKQRISFAQFLLDYDIVLNPKVKDFLNRDIGTFVKSRSKK